LWQLTTDNAGTFKLFGKSGGTPLITTLFVDATGGPKEVPVAVLPGGGGTAAAGACPATARTFTGVDPEFPPRGKVRCYDSADVGSRSLTIVRLDTGEILRTFRQTTAEIVLSDGAAQTKLRNKVSVTPLDSPITGQPVAFPFGTGVISDRIFVGDQDGRLWKVNVASTNPANWTMNLFFDAYPATYGTDPNFPNAYDSGQPILLPPVLSVDAVGDVTVNVATGDQDALGAAAGMKTFVWSLTEKTTSDRTPAASDANWFLPMTGGERVVGPMELFNSALYFASYAPPGASSGACNNGVSKVWGVHYTLPPAGPGDTLLVNQGGRAQLPGPSGLVQYLTASGATGDADAVIFGVTIAQQPTCTTTASKNVSDSFGSGLRTVTTDVTPGKFQLVMHTGSGGTQIPGGQSRTATIDLSPPVSRAKVDSWAVLVE
jgi:type IV pilus assembly protein PilY1